MYDILITNCNLITMNDKNDVLNGTCLGITKEKIDYIGSYDENINAKKIIDGTNLVVMPGLIDSHAHAGHGMLKTVGEGMLDEDLLDLYEYIYYQCSTPEFWYLEAQLSALEKIKFGTTTSMSYLGSQPRYDELIYGDYHVEGVRKSGMRDILGIGTPNPPFPKYFRKWSNNKPTDKYAVCFEESFKTTYDAVKKHNNTNNGLTFCYPTPSYIGYRKSMSIEKLKSQNKAMKCISEEFGTPIHSHAYKGDVKFAYENLDILSEKVSLAHVTGVDSEEIKILAETGTHVCSGPFTVAYVESRCPVIEMLEAKVNVSFCTDASAPNRSYDLFEKMRIGTLLHRSYFNNNNILPPGQVLKMVTINAAKAIGLDKIIGSIEIGKKADVICIDMKKPHLYPRWHDPVRLVYEALGNDVKNVIVNGKLIMENYEILTLDEEKVLEEVQTMAIKTLEKADALKYTELPIDFWNSIKYSNFKKFLLN